jgi:hypothetical protein
MPRTKAPFKPQPAQITGLGKKSHGGEVAFHQAGCLTGLFRHQVGIV